MSNNETQSAKILNFPGKTTSVERPVTPAHRQTDVSGFDRKPVFPSAEAAVAPKTVEPARLTKRGMKLARIGREAIVYGSVATGLAAAMYLGYEALKDESLPQPEKTGVMVNIYPQDGEGKIQLLHDLARRGVDSEQLRTAVEATEDDKGGLVQGPIPVDTGFLTTDQDVLLEYGVRPQELTPTQ